MPGTDPVSVYCQKFQVLPPQRLQLVQQLHGFLVLEVIAGEAEQVLPIVVLEAKVRDDLVVQLEGTTVLPHTVLGAGLDVAHAVVDGNKFVDLQRDVALQIDDPILLRDSAPRAMRAEGTQELGTERSLEFDYSQYLTRAADRLAVLFRG